MPARTVFRMPASGGRAGSGRASAAAILTGLALALGGATFASQSAHAQRVGQAQASQGGGNSPAQACPPLLEHSFPRLQDESTVELCQFAGKVLLVVNTASKWGYTGQYEGLEKLHARYAARGLVVMGFPSNDFNLHPSTSNKRPSSF